MPPSSVTNDIHWSQSGLDSLLSDAPYLVPPVSGRSIRSGADVTLIRMGGIGLPGEYEANISGLTDAERASWIFGLEFGTSRAEFALDGTRQGVSNNYKVSLTADHNTWITAWNAAGDPNLTAYLYSPKPTVFLTPNARHGTRGSAAGRAAGAAIRHGGSRHGTRGDGRGVLLPPAEGVSGSRHGLRGSEPATLAFAILEAGARHGTRGSESEGYTLGPAEGTAGSRHATRGDELEQLRYAPATAGSRHSTRGSEGFTPDYIGGTAVAQLAFHLRLESTGMDAKLRNYWIDAYLGDAWVDISADLLGEMSFSAGLGGGGPMDRVAGSGSLRFTLDARDGRYNPRRSNVLAGWAWGTRVRVRVLTPHGTERVRWAGSLSRIQPSSGKFGTRIVNVVAVDWMNLAAVSVRPATSRNVRADQVIQAVINELPVSDRPTMSLDQGSEAYTHTLYDCKDGVPIRTLFQRVALCEGGLIFVNGSGTLRFRNRLADNAAVAYTFDETHIPDDGLEVPDDLSDVYTRIEVTTHPVRVDGLRVALYESVSAIKVDAGTTVKLFAEYRNPDTKTQTVGGFDLGGHSYSATEGSDGTGADLSSSVSMTVEETGGAAEITLVNAGATNAYVTGIVIRGKGVYDEQPVTALHEQASRYPTTLRYDMPYQESYEIAEFFADHLSRRYGRTDNRANAVAIDGRRSVYAANALAEIEVGDKVKLKEGQTGVDLNVIVVGYEMVIDESFRISGRLRTAPLEIGDSVPAGAWVWDESLWDTGTWG